MATAAEAVASADVQDTGDQDTTPIDFEAEARKIGWRPVEEFKGDPAQHVDAETFYKRGQEVMPLLKAQNKALTQKIAQLEKQGRQAAEYFSKAEERAYERAVADLKQRGEAAAKSGDTAELGKVMDEMTKLEKPSAPNAVDTDQRMEEFADWAASNGWYADNDVLRMYADAQAEKIARQKGGLLDREDLDTVAQAVKAKFEGRYPDVFGAPAPKPKPRSAVDGGGTAPRQRGGKTFADLPVEAQRIADKWVANGIIKDRETYVKSYQW